MKQKKPVTRETMKVMIRRYLVVTTIGLALCILFFWQLSHRPISEAPSLWTLMGAGVGGIMLTGGLFGMVLHYFFLFLHRNG